MSPWSAPPPSERDYYTVAEMAEKTGYGSERVRQLADAGVWPCDRVAHGSRVERRFPKKRVDKLNLSQDRRRVERDTPRSTELNYLREQNRTLHTELEHARGTNKALEEQLAAQVAESRRLRNAVTALTDGAGAAVDEVEAFLRRQ